MGPMCTRSEKLEGGSSHEKKLHGNRGEVFGDDAEFWR